jgi:translation initiation factor IF-2
VSSSKKRVYDLAKEYGMSGQELATKLKELGISEVKGAMSALDEFQLLRIEATLEANGIVSASRSASGQESSGGLTIRKTKKIKKVAPVEVAEPEASEEEEVAEAVAEPEEPQAPAPPEEPEPEPEEDFAPVEAGPAVQATRPPAPALRAPSAPPAPPLPAPSPTAPFRAPRTQEPAPAPPQPAPAAARQSPATTAPVRAPAPAPAVPGPRAPGAAPKPEAPAAGDEKPKILRPAVKRRAGKVVGFVDLTKVQTTPAAKRPESRRLRSKDDVTPDVRPTLGHDRKRALMRGDHASRGQLTAAQLREKEAGRFLRRRGVGVAPPRGARGVRGPDASGSPLAGSEVVVEAPITIKKLAEALSVKANQVIAKAFTSLKLPVNINSNLDEDTAGLLSMEFDVTLKITHEVHAETELLDELVKHRTEVEEAELVVRPPTIAFLGHVDHGKTTLLDHIRQSRVAAGESGGITQHIGGYQVHTKAGHTLTILDTPGHEAFTAMRARGAQAVDIVVLVIAADDGVMPSTIEAINHARAAKVPIVVALNKVDKPSANTDRVKQQLTAHNLLAEDYGGEVAMLPVSGLTGQGVEQLLERVFLESEVLELRAHARGPGTGIVIEAEKHEGKGPVAYLLIKDGTLNRGDVILAGEGYGKVRSIHDDRGKAIQKAGPSMPVEVSGLTELPSVGEQFYVVADLKRAREVAEERTRRNRMMSLAERQSVTKENLLQTVAEQSKQTINVILKADVQGSLQALTQQLASLTHDEVVVRVIHSAIGAVTESDVSLAIPSNAVVLAFRVSSHDKGRVLADRSGIEIRPYDVIYELLDDLRAMMEGSLAPEMTEQITGHAEVRALFKSSRLGNIAGCFVLDGSIFRDSKVRVLRGKEVLKTGTILSLRREKDDVKEVREAFECGIVVKDFDAYEVGDVIEAFKVVAVKRLLKI